MKRLIAMVLCSMALAAGMMQAHAESGPDVTYFGGSVPGIRVGTAGTLDMTLADELKFGGGGETVAIPYAKVARVEYREENRFRLGVVGTIVVGMVKARQKVHTVTITWMDDKDTANVATLEMTREKANELLDVLRAKTHAVPTVCEAKFNRSCTKPR